MQDEARAPRSLDAIERVCQWCSKPFTALYRDVKRGQGLFCTKRCAAFARPHQPKEIIPLAQRFWESVLVGVGCWSWGGVTDSNGYGRIQEQTRRKTMVLAHRVAWTLLRGPIPDGLSVLHQCDNTGCVRPDHLYLGTQMENAGDMAHRERWANQHVRARNNASNVRRIGLSAADVSAMRRRWEGGNITVAAMVRLFGVSYYNAWDIVKGRHWKHVS